MCINRVDPRKEAAILNLQLRKRYINGKIG